MTALVFSLQEKQVIVAMDTLSAYEKNGVEIPFLFTSKMYPVLHLNGLICGTGVGNLIADWFIRTKDFVVGDLIHLNQFAQPILSEISGKFESKHGDYPSTVYHFCWNKYENRYRGYAFRSTSDFQIEELSYGTATKPGVPDAIIEDYPESFIKIMIRQREIERQKPITEQVFIGGEIQLAVMEQGAGIALYTVYKFDDYTTQYQTMCKNLPDS